MKSLLSRIFLLMTLILVTMSCQSGDIGADLKTIPKMVTAHPDNVSVLFENNYVVVLEYKLTPGDNLPKHELGNRAIYVLTKCEIKFNIDNNKDVTKSSDGDIYWQKENTLAPENVGQTDARMVVVARKDALLPNFALEDLDQDVSQTNPEIATLLLDNDYIRVIEVNLEPGEEIKTHRGIARVVYSLKPYTIDYLSEETDSMIQKTFEPGHTHWHQTGSHSLINIGETAMQDLVFEFKK